MLINIRSFFLFAFLSLPLVADAQQPSAADLNTEYTAYKKFAAEGKWAASLTHARKAYEIGKSILKPDDKNLAALANNYGHNLIELKQYSEAQKILDDALELYETIYGKNSPELLLILFDIGVLNTHQLTDRDTRYYDRVLKIIETTSGEDSIEYGNMSVKIGATMLSPPSPKAKPYLTRGYKILAKHVSEPHVGLALANFNLGRYELSVKNYDEAVEFFKKTLASVTDPGKPPSQIELSTHGFLVYAYENLEQSDLATEHCLAIGRMTPADPNQEIMPIFRKIPQYPYSDRSAGKEGYATFEFDIDESGFVRNIHGVENSGGNFESAAIKALEKWRYAPSFVEGKPVATTNVRTTIKFELAD